MHTQGPWKPFEEFPLTVHAGEEIGGDWICTMVRNGFEESDYREAVDNAALVAAAPSLLSELAALIDEIESLRLDGILAPCEPPIDSAKSLLNSLKVSQ